MKHTEENLQIACIKWFDYQFPSYRPLMHHSPNGGKRNAREAARFKAMGTRAGFPDLILMIPNLQYFMLWIEMKSDKGRQSEHQKEYQILAEKNEIKYVICRSFEEFRETVTDYIQHIEL